MGRGQHGNCYVALSRRSPENWQSTAWVPERTTRALAPPGNRPGTGNAGNGTAVDLVAHFDGNTKVWRLHRLTGHKKHS